MEERGAPSRHDGPACPGLVRSVPMEPSFAETLEREAAFGLAYAP